MMNVVPVMDQECLKVIVIVTVILWAVMENVTLLLTTLINVVNVTDRVLKAQLVIVKETKEMNVVFAMDLEFLQDIVIVMAAIWIVTVSAVELLVPIIAVYVMDQVLSTLTVIVKETQEIVKVLVVVML